jgi:hypothetical protein
MSPLVYPPEPLTQPSTALCSDIDPRRFVGRRLLKTFARRQWIPPSSPAFDRASYSWVNVTANRCRAHRISVLPAPSVLTTHILHVGCTSLIHPQEHLSSGRAVKAMILNGLGFVSTPLYLLGEFFAGEGHRALDRPGRQARAPQRRSARPGCWIGSLKQT